MSYAAWHNGSITGSRLPLRKTRKTITKYGRELLYRSGLLGLLHRIRNKRTLTVLMFHRVLPQASDEFRRAEREFTFSNEGFRRCLDFVKRHYNVVNLAQVIDAGEGRITLPPCSALITFDDGWRDTVTHALPILQQQALPGVLFLSTEVTDCADVRWWQDALVELAVDPKKLRHLAHELGHTTPDEARLPELTAMLASRKPAERAELVARRVSNVSERQMLTRTEVSSLKQQCLAVAAHGHTHAPLALAADPLAELVTSHGRIKELGGDPSSMSLPHGSYNNRVLKAARAAGFRWIFTSLAALNPVNELREFRLISRIHVPENYWTCTADGQISATRLASFLFLRPIRCTEQKTHKDCNV